jgi:hypothetical protein
VLLVLGLALVAGVALAFLDERAAGATGKRFGERHRELARGGTPAVSLEEIEEIARQQEMAYS